MTNARATADAGPLQRTGAALQAIARRAPRRAGARIGETVFRARIDGHELGRFRLRSVVDGSDRMSIYSIGLILPEEMVSSAEAVTSDRGRMHGVALATPDGRLELTSAPGMRPSRRRRRA